MTTTLQQLTASQANKEVAVNRNFETLSALGVYGKKQSTSSGLTWGYYGGRWSGFSVADGTFTLTNASDNYIVAKRSDGVTSAATTTTNWNNTTDYARVYKVTTAGSVVTATEDHRAGLYGVHGIAVSPTAVGDVVGPGSATNNNLVQFDGTTGKLIEDAAVAVSTDGTFAANSNAKIPTEAAVKTYVDAEVAGATGNVATDAIWDAAGDLVQGTGSNTAARLALGTAGQVLKVNAGATAVEWGAGAGDVATDAIWDAAGDLAVGSGANTAAKLAMGTALQVLRVNAGATNLEWAAAGGSTQGKQEFYVPASAIRPTISNGAAYPSTIETQVNAQDLTTIDFDATAAENVQFAVVLPKKWNGGTLTAKFYWSHAATTTNFGVVWYAQFVVFRDGDLINTTTWGTLQQVADTGGTTNNMYVSAETSAITPGGTVADGCLVYCRLGRLPSDGSDTMVIDARLHGVMFSCTTDADTDA
jgi:hypothetical protein